LEKFNNCKNDSFVFVNDNLEVLGFMFLRLSTWSNGPQAILEEIVVSPSNQNMGIGKELMKYSCDYLNSKGIKSVMLWAKNDERLLNFYKKQGFSAASDFVVMFKN
jgi:ribosomal protein S18 acetylase RimI-like enzyme